MIPPDSKLVQPNTSVPSGRARAILTPEQAFTIYRAKPQLDHGGRRRRGQQAAAKSVAEDFGVSEKTIRDIWKGRTWLRETVRLDPALAARASRLRQPGRPRGSKRPRSGARAERGAAAAAGRGRGGPSIGSEASPTTPAATISPGPGGLKGPATGTTPDRMPAPGPAAEKQPPGRSPAQTVIRGEPEQPAGGWPGAVPFDPPAAPAEPEIEPLPCCTCADDPFHDDWPHWPPPPGPIAGPAAPSLAPG